MWGVNMVDFIDTYFYLVAGLSGLIVAQFLKPICAIIRNRKFDLKLIFASGSFPSSHTALVVSLTYAIGMREGYASAAFAISLCISLVVMYDAMNVRFYAGKNIALTQQIIKDLQSHSFKLDNPIYIESLKEILGHERLEVFAGLILGLIIPNILNSMV